MEESQCSFSEQELLSNVSEQEKSSPLQPVYIVVRLLKNRTRISIRKASGIFTIIKLKAIGN